MKKRKADDLNNAIMFEYLLQGIGVTRLMVHVKMPDRHPFYIYIEEVDGKWGLAGEFMTLFNETYDDVLANQRST
jgi:hypothetical protein